MCHFVLLILTVADFQSRQGNDFVYTVNKTTLHLSGLFHYSKTCLEGPLPREITCLEGQHTPGGMSHILVQVILSPKTTCLKRPYFYGQWGLSFKTGSTVLYTFQVYQLVSHLVYWGKVMIIYPLCETNVYVLAPSTNTCV